jgi:glyoxylase-like metal-dependent hydrolase (beta-lactamase superfamily II)
MPIRPLDLNFQNAPQAVYAFLIVGPAGPVLVETGPGSTLPALIIGLAHFGFTVADVRDVLLTHIHLDHAGAAGWWARQGARVWVHPVGAPHLVDPSKLLASAQRIYGDQMDALWGEFLSTPAEQLHIVKDGETVEAGGLRFIAHDTPGHARHHLAYQLDDVIFTGDVAGVRFSGQHYLYMPTPPPEFELPVWLASVERLQALNARRLYLTHGGAIDEVADHWARVSILLQEVAELSRGFVAEGLSRDAALNQFAHWNAARRQAESLNHDLIRRYDVVGAQGMSLDGLLRYWQRQNRTATPATT